MRHAGAIFLGRHTPEAMGDYIAGPNHVLPTSRTARFSSGLSVLDFMKRTTLAALDAPTHRRARSGRDHPGRSRRAGRACPLHRGAPERAGQALTMPSDSSFRLSPITLDERSVVRRTREIEQEREVAIYDLLEANSFAPEGSQGGPYRLVLGVEENRLVFDIRLEDGDASMARSCCR